MAFGFFSEVISFPNESKIMFLYLIFVLKAPFARLDEIEIVAAFFLFSLVSSFAFMLHACDFDRTIHPQSHSFCREMGEFPTGHFTTFSVARGSGIRF